MKTEYQFYPFNYKGLVLADETCAVIKGENPMAGYSGHCGYCVFPKDEIPVEWHGDYNADGLGLLNVHGGITYCSVHGNNDEDRCSAVKASVEKFYAENPISDGVENATAMERIRKRMDLAKRVAREVPYTHVVFGFDTAHYGDNSRYELFDAEHVFRLAKVMRQQIAEHARRIVEYRESSRDRQVEILDEIRASADLESEIAPFQMISMIARASE